MNHEGEASSSAAGPSSHHHDEQRQEPAPTAAELAERRKKNRQMFNRKRGDLLDHLIRDIDLLIYAELSTIYYMDCSFLRFALRAFAQFIYLTPKHAPFTDPQSDRPMLGGLLGSNAVCLLLHLWLSPPSAGEATRGYLHGGLAMDFIGQAGPSSRIHLVLLDLLVVILQLTHMAAYMLRSRLKEASSATATTTGTEEIAAPQPAPAVRQDLDAEERGVIRTDDQQDVEMQTLNPAGEATNAAAAASEAANGSSDRDALLSDQPRTDAHIFDAFHSGQIVVADLDIRKRIKDQIQLMKNYRADTTAAASSAQTLRFELANRVLRMRMGADALRQTI